MEEQQRSQRVTPRRLSFSLDDFIRAEGVGGNGSGAVNTNNDQPRTTIDEDEHTQPEINLLKNLETPTSMLVNTGGDTPLVVSAAVLNSILTGQQSLANMVTDLSTIVHSQRRDRTKNQINVTKESRDDAPVTQRELRQLLQNKHSPPNAIFDLEPPLADVVTTIPYPGGYQPPTIHKFDGTGSAKEHIMSFLDDLGIHRSDKNLRLKEFSKSLSGRAFTWYAKLKPYSIETWEDLVTEFCGKFLEEEGALHIMDLGRCKEMLPEADLVYGCIKNVEDGSQIFFSLSGITTFAELMKKATDVADAMKRQGKRTKGLEDMFDVCATEERDRKKTFKSNRSSVKASTFNEAPPIPLGCLQVKLGKVLLPENERGEELHRRALPNHSVSTIGAHTNEVRIEEVEEAYDEERALSIGLAKTRGFRMLFGQLGMEGDAQREAAEAIIHIGRKWGGHLGAVNAPLTRLARSHATTIIFREPPEASPQFCHNRPLYVEATIEGIKVRIALVDNGLGVNIIPSSIFHRLKMPRGRIRKSEVMLSTFLGEAVESPGRVHAVLEVGPIKTVNMFQVVEAPPGSSQLKTEQGILLKDIECYNEPGYVHHPVQAFKRPKAKNVVGIEKEYIPNGESIARNEEEGEIKEAPKQLQDLPEEQEDKLEEVDVSEDAERRPLFISTTLEGHEKERLVRLLREFKDVFAWKYEEMPGLSANLITHNLATYPNVKPLIGPMRELLKESNKYAWEKRHQESFEKIKKAVASTPIMSPPVKGIPLRLYLTVSQHAINGLIAQEIEGKERLVSYLSRVVKDTEARYTMQEKYCLGVVYAAQKYKHYFQAHTIHIVSKYEGIKLIDEALRLISFFKEVHLSHVPRAKNRHVDALATIGSKEIGRMDGSGIAFHKVEGPSLSMVPREDESQDWRRPILSQFKQKIFSKVNRDYHELRGELYRKSVDGLLMKCVTEAEGGKKPECLHQAVCGQEGPCLYRRMQRVERACPSCKEEREPLEVNTIESDWRKELKDFLSTGITPSAPLEAEKLKRRAQRYFLQECELFKEGFSGNILRCLGKEEQETIMGETHGGVCGRHQGGRSLWAEILKNGYYWPSMKEDTIAFAKRFMSTTTLICAKVLEKSKQKHKKRKKRRGGHKEYIMEA
ncbi:Aspartic peptidase domain superfamily [Sesbania bispinosa]|nr:Aspartic peptidase domain superfamily [Sesbania bispinosa]